MNPSHWFEFSSLTQWFSLIDSNSAHLLSDWVTLILIQIIDSIIQSHWLEFNSLTPGISLTDLGLTYWFGLTDSSSNQFSD